jgi:hypothetical protein
LVAQRYTDQTNLQKRARKMRSISWEWKIKLKVKQKQEVQENLMSRKNKQCTHNTHNATQEKRHTHRTYSQNNKTLTISTTYMAMHAFKTTEITRTTSTFTTCNQQKILNILVEHMIRLKSHGTKTLCHTGNSL